MTKIKDIAPGVSIGMTSGTVMEIIKSETEPDALLENQVSTKPYAIWGKDNNYPQRVIDSNMQQETSAGALMFKSIAHFGRGLYFYYSDVDDNGNEKQRMVKFTSLPLEIQEFYRVNNLNNFIQGIIQDFEWWNFFYVQYIPNKAKNKIVQLNWIRTRDVRTAKRDPKNGKIPAYHISDNWKLQNPVINSVPVFDENEPFRYPNAVMKHQLVSIDKDYYPTAYWQSNFRWIEVARRIPRWILANITNSVNIKYHVEIPERYFLDLYPDKNYNSAQEALTARKTAEENLKREIDACLAGEENAMKIFYTKFAVDMNGNVIPGWKITPIGNDLKDAAWLSAYATGAAAICTAHGVDPGLTGIVSPSALNVGSGSDLREKFNFYMQLRTVIPRQTTLEWWEIVKRVNGWDPDLHLGYRNILLDTLNTAKGGFQVENESNPTSPNKAL